MLNGGVTGYGFDQTVLRAEQLADRYTPSLIIVSFIEDDLKRAELSTLWWRNKPWFAMENGQLIYKAAAGPDGAKLPRLFHSILGRCFHKLPPRLEARAHLVENTLLACLPPKLQHRIGYSVRVHPAGVGIEIGRRLVERLAQLQKNRESEVVIMAQYPPWVWADWSEAKRQRHATQVILDRAAAFGIATLDTYNRIAAEPAPDRLYAKGYMNARGNAMIASLLAATQRPG